MRCDCSWLFEQLQVHRVYCAILVEDFSELRSDVGLPHISAQRACNAKGAASLGLLFHRILRLVGLGSSALGSIG